ncbi:MAG: hypothetical protein ACRDPW_07730 [Mycobacteriales bacterium]
MIGLDTNVLVRYLAQDGSEQSARATRLVESLDGDNQGLSLLANFAFLLCAPQAAPGCVVGDSR